MYLPTKKACKFLGVHPNTLRRWAKQGKIKFIWSPSHQRLYDVQSILPKPTKNEENKEIDVPSQYDGQTNNNPEENTEDSND